MIALMHVQDKDSLRLQGSFAPTRTARVDVYQTVPLSESH